MSPHSDQALELSGQYLGKMTLMLKVLEMGPLAGRFQTVKSQ